VLLRGMRFVGILPILVLGIENKLDVSIVRDLHRV